MPRFHGIPVGSLSVYPQWMHDQIPVRVETLRKGTLFVAFSSSGPGDSFILGEKHNSPFVYHTTEVATGRPNCIGASALVWPVNEKWNHEDEIALTDEEYRRQFPASEVRSGVRMFPACAKCGETLRGHEDETATHCRWCVTCTEVAST